MKLYKDTTRKAPGATSPTLTMQAIAAQLSAEDMHPVAGTSVGASQAGEGGGDAAGGSPVAVRYPRGDVAGHGSWSPLERYSRAVQVLRHHAFGAESRYETVGQVYLGLPPDFPFVVF
jgi:hypothetical protein